MFRRHNPLNLSGLGSGAVTRRAAASYLAACAILAGSMFAVAPARAASATTPTEMFVQENIDKGYNILNNTKLTKDQRHQQFHAFIVGLTDMRRIGIFTLGQYARGASQAELDAFITSFTEYAVAVYETRLGKYTGQTFRITGSIQRAADDVVVNTDVVSTTNAAAEPFKAAFRVRKTSDGRFILTDIQVEGIWLALSQRSDFTGFLQQHGGKLSDLITDLNRQTGTLLGDVAPKSASR
jgi:phospholipid transport system substrate-binding protein